MTTEERLGDISWGSNIHIYTEIDMMGEMDQEIGELQSNYLELKQKPYTAIYLLYPPPLYKE